MSTVLYPSPIFGPIKSRRLGISLGINLLPADGKICTFDCIYCECGYNKDFRPHNSFIKRNIVKIELEKKLQEMTQQKISPDVLTFAGNGEPTLHPQFEEIVGDTMALRDTYFSSAKISVLSNATQILKPSVFRALCKVDNNILKLDTVDFQYIRLINQPSCVYNIDHLINCMKQFNGHLIIQTMFLKGTYNNICVDNISDFYVKPWLDVLKQINPEQVMIYTIDRETPDHDLKKALPEELDAIALKVRRQGMKVSVGY